MARTLGVWLAATSLLFLSVATIVHSTMDLLLPASHVLALLAIAAFIAERSGKASV